MSDIYKQEVKELTSLLRSDEDWKELREILITKGFELNKIALAVFNEDDEENEFGVIVDKNHKVYAYLRSNNVGADKTYNFHLSEITNEKDQIIKYPQVDAAIRMFQMGII